MLHQPRPSPRVRPGPRTAPDRAFAGATATRSTMSTMPSLFTRLITGELPGEFVFKDRLWAALLDISPANPGHCLLVPVHEAQYLAQLPAETLAALGPALTRLIGAVKGATSCPAVNVLVNDGPEANQAVPHAHLHVIPRYTADGKLSHPKGTAYPAGALAAMAERLRRAAG